MALEVTDLPEETKVLVPFFEVRPACQKLRADFNAAWNQVMESGSYILGEELENFESEFASYCGAAFCAGCGSGLDALRMILDGYGIGPGDEVLVPAHTFIATWLAVMHTGARPVAIDADVETCNIDPGLQESAVTSRTAIIAVHLYGQPAQMDAIRTVASRYTLRVIEDAAQAHGATFAGRRGGSLGDVAAFSFYPAKNLGAFGDGGAVVSSDEDLIHRVRKLRNYGAASKYIHELKGYNSRLDPSSRLPSRPFTAPRRLESSPQCHYRAILPGTRRHLHPACRRARRGPGLEHLCDKTRGARPAAFGTMRSRDADPLPDATASLTGLSRSRLSEG